MNMLSSLLDTTWAEALGWTLLHSLWQGVIWVALLRLGTYLLKGRPAQYRYALTLLSVFGLAMTAILTFIQGYQSSVGVAKGFELLPAEAKTYIWAASDLGAGGTWWEVMTNQINAIAPWLTGAWLLGLGLFLIRWIGAYFHVQELRYREAKPMNYHWQDRINELGRQIGIRRTVLLIESRRVSGPLSLGHFKPVVLVPMGLFTGLSPVQIEAILAHELAHIRRHDYLINLMVSLLEVVFFYHPAMWYLFREVSQAREHCCDDLAVATCGSAMDYAKTLAWLAENPSSKVSLASGMGGKRQDLLHRIKRLLTPQQIPGNPGKAALALVLLLSMTTLAWLSPDLNEDADKNFVQRILEGPIGNQLPWFYEKPAQTEAPVPANLSTPTLPVASVAPQNWAGSWNQANCIVVMPLDSPPPNLPMIAPAPPPPPMPAPPVIGEDFNPAQTQAAWEAYGRQMENWGKELGNLQSEYGQRYAESMEEYAEAMQEWAETEAARQSEAFEEDYKVRELERRVQRIHEANVLNQERALRDLERSSRLEKMSKQELRRVQMEMELAMKALEQVNGDQSVDQAKIQQAQRKIERAQKEIEEA
ncbi:MAG: M56 family metallopeptidase, partial [Bacteroidota bacterium]